MVYLFEAQYEFDGKLITAYGEKYFNGRKEIMRTYMTTGCSDLSPVIQVYHSKFHFLTN